MKKFLAPIAITACVLCLAGCSMGSEPTNKITDPLPDKVVESEVEEETTEAEEEKTTEATTEKHVKTDEELNQEYEEWKAEVLKDRDEATEEQTTETTEATTEETTEAYDPYAGLAVSNCHSVTLPKGVDYNTAAIIRFENGVRAAFNVGMIFGKQGNGRMDRLYVHGTKGIIRSTVEYNQEGELSYTIETDSGIITRTVQARQNYALEVENLGRCIEGTEMPHVTKEFSLRNARVIDKILDEMGYN